MMSHYRKIFGMAAIVLASCSSGANAQYLTINGTIVDDFSGIDEIRYAAFSANRTFDKYKSPTEKIEKDFLFINEDTVFFHQRYIYRTGLGIWKFPEKKELIMAYDIKVVSEFYWFGLERSGLVKRLDIIDRSLFRDDMAKNYDYIISMRSSSNGKWDKKSANARKTEYFVKSVKTGDEIKIAETTGSPLLYGLEDMAVKLSNFNKLPSMSAP